MSHCGEDDATRTVDFVRVKTCEMNSRDPTDNGMKNEAPDDPRMTFSLNGLQEFSTKNIPSMPNAKEVRINVPKFPGSET